jgi:hypothetical protein
MELEDARPGTSVLVRSDYRDPHRQGAAGTIKKRYGTTDYRVFGVSFPDGRIELFWDHQLEEAKDPSPGLSAGGSSGSKRHRSFLRGRSYACWMGKGYRGEGCRTVIIFVAITSPERLTGRPSIGYRRTEANKVTLN